jgi:ribosome-associated protein
MKLGGGKDGFATASEGEDEDEEAPARPARKTAARRR